jgi:hypothetical protein
MQKCVPGDKHNQQFQACFNTSQGGRTMKHSKSILFRGLILSTFVATAGSPLRAASPQWDILRTLRPGQQIRVVASGARSYQGEFQALSEEGITLRQPAGERTFARKDILRVSIRAKKRWIRNTVIGVFAGASIGIPLMYINRRNGWWHNDWPCSCTWVSPVFTTIVGLAGTAITSAGQWHDIYRSPSFWTYAD